MLRLKGGIGKLIASLRQSGAEKQDEGEFFSL